jgi:hypothetical protein
MAVITDLIYIDMYAVILIIGQVTELTEELIEAQYAP